MILKNIKKFLFENYHRPGAKIQHFFSLIKKITLNKKSDFFAERVMLLKTPPNSMQYYNFFGRILFFLRNIFSLTFIRNFYDRDLSLENDVINSSKPNKIGSDNEPWPIQALHLFEQKKSLDNLYINKLEKDYLESCLKLEKDEYFKQTDWWQECRDEFNSIFLENHKIKIEKLHDFRNDTNTKAEILLDQNFISRKNSNLVNKIRSLSIVNLYHKMSNHIDLDILRICSESKIGNNLSTVYRGQRIGYRIIRYAYYLSQIRKFAKIDNKEKNFFIDIGGGYGGLSRVLKNFYGNSTIVIIELPELCLLANYFLHQCFKDPKIASYTDFQDKKSISKNDIKDYDFVILPPNEIVKFENDIFDLSINTTSLGEMTSEMQEYYTDNIERITSKFFYSVNRAKKRTEKYNSNGFYNLNFKKKWRSSIYKFTHTYHIEFLGEKIND
tara:strand:+ start:2730 stop:4055 length:1326 start_codon:yes stop_codon:yes gene_type:complete